jgi:hypothetical protein
VVHDYPFQKGLLDSRRAALGSIPASSSNLGGNWLSAWRV